MREKFWISSIIWLVLVLNLSSVRAATIDFERLFFGRQGVTYLSSHRLVASYVSEHSSLYVIINFELDKIFAVSIGDEMPLGDEKIVLKGIDSNQLIFENAVGHSFIVENKESTSSDRVVRKKVETPRNRFQLPNEDSALNEFKSMAVALGIPKQIINQFNKTPGLGRDSFGRPGWLLDETIPSPLLQLSPFLKNDLIIAVNGIAINEREPLMRHIEFGDHNKEFEVEIERSGELKLIRVRF